MFKELIDKATSQYSKNQPFVVYRKPKEHTVIGLFQKDDTLHYAIDFTESGFVFAPFEAKNKIVLLHADERLEADSKAVNIAKEGPLEIKSNESQKDFHQTLVKKGIEHIKNKKFQKVVLSRKQEFDCTTEPLVLFQKLLSMYDTAFCYIWHHPKVGTWLGATPEILLKGERQKITTMSLAGTQLWYKDVKPNWGIKELEEQQLVTDYIADTLKDKVTNLVISEQETIRAGKLLHLRTKLTGSYEEQRLLEVAMALHPTPAVCGLPMASSKAFILENENYDREYYTGFLGELNLKTETQRSLRRRNQENQAYKAIKATTTFFVNLRCMQLKERKAIVYVGGGVTKDSNPEKEWEETVAKITTIGVVLTKP